MSTAEMERVSDQNPKFREVGGVGDTTWGGYACPPSRGSGAHPRVQQGGLKGVVGEQGRE